MQSEQLWWRIGNRWCLCQHWPCWASQVRNASAWSFHQGNGLHRCSYLELKGKSEIKALWDRAWYSGLGLICYFAKLTSSSISFGKVSTLDHEFLNDSVELASLVTEPFLLKEQTCVGSQCFTLESEQNKPGTYSKCTFMVGVLCWVLLIPPAATHLSHLSWCQRPKVVNCFGDCFPKQSDDDSSKAFLSHFHLKVHLKLKSGTCHK